MEIKEKTNTMTIQVRCFASLGEQMGFTQKSIAADGMLTVRDVWGAVGEGKSLPDSVLFAVNMSYVSADSLVNDGDEVAFFPPVTGGGR